MAKFVDLSGQKFNRLTVLSLHHKKQLYNKKGRPNGHLYYYLCRCDCGRTTIVAGTLLKRGSVKSCGCLRKEEQCKSSNKHKIHGMRSSRLYRIYQSMKGRCYYPCVKGYERYGGRGISICEEWYQDFLSFYKWSLENGYNDTLSIDRINIDGNYEPSNCRWVSPKVQGRNTRTNHRITYKGETHCLIEWAEILKINYGTLKNRIRRGWSTERAFEEPIHEEKRRY